MGDLPTGPWVYPYMWVIGIGMRPFADVLEEQLKKIAQDSLWTSWWSQTPYTDLLVEATLTGKGEPPHQNRRLTRTSGQDLVVKYSRPYASLPRPLDHEQLEALAQNDLHAILSEAAIRRRWPEPPKPYVR